MEFTSNNDDKNNDNNNANLCLTNYFYGGLSKISSIENNRHFLKNNTFSKAYICCYEINTKACKPFLQFLLNKNTLNDVLSFPFVDIFLFDNNEDNLLSYLEMYIYIIFSKVYINEKMMLDGYYIYENDIYFFYNLTNCQIEMNDIYRENNAWLCLVDEIVNQKHMCNMKIEEHISDFFILNNEFMLLKDLNDNILESPMALYVGKEEKWINFTFMFGESKLDKNNLLGPYYYFTNFSNAIEQFKNKNKNKNKNQIIDNLNNINTKNHSKLGLIRFAIFLGNMKVIKNKLQDEDNDISYETLLMRVTDYGGLWTKYHDSCYLGKIELDNGTFVKDAPIWVIKEYEQQFPLSYHFLDKRYLGDNDEENNYCIA